MTTTQLFHINDVIAPNDTTVKRLELQYQLLLTHIFGIDTYKLHLIPSEPGNSAQTGQQLLSLVQSLDIHGLDDRYVIVVNNASRGIYKNFSNAKGSECLRASVVLPSSKKLFEVVGVDNRVFAQFSQYIKELKIVENVTVGDKHIKSIFHKDIKDISQGSQFRSLEFWPLVQMSILTDFSHSSLECKHVSKELLATHFLPYITKQEREKNVDITQVDKDRVEVQHGYTPSPVVYESSLGTKPLEYQLEGQRNRFLRDWEIGDHLQTFTHQNTFNEIFDNIDCPRYVVKLLLIDKDRFGNIKAFAPSEHGNGIYEIVCRLDGDGLNKNNQVKVSWQQGNRTVEDTGFITESIGDLPGKKCIRNGSSCGPDGSVLVELNRSFGKTTRVWEKIQNAPMGTIVELSAK